MTTSLKEWSAYANDEASPLNESDKAYFQAKMRRHVHGVVLERFMELSDDDRISRAALAKRLGLSRAQITRWLSSPGNWTLDTLSDLLLAMNCQASIIAEKISSQGPRNFVHEFSQEAQPNNDGLAAEHEERSRVVINLGRSATFESAGTLQAR